MKLLFPFSIDRILLNFLPDVYHGKEWWHRLLSCRLKSVIIAFLHAQHCCDIRLSTVIQTCGLLQSTYCQFFDVSLSFRSYKLLFLTTSRLRNEIFKCFNFYHRRKESLY